MGGESLFFLPLFRIKKIAFLGKNREKKKGRDIITHTNARAFLLLRDETFEKTTQGLSASRAAVVVVVPKKKTTFSIDVFFRAEVLRPIRERERERKREKKKNGILGNDVRVRRPRRRVRGVHQRHGHSRREPPETRALDNGGDVHVDDVGDNIHGANAPVSATGDEQKRGVEMKSKVENRVFVTRRARETLRREST